MRIEWSADALADLDRFAEFLHRHHPAMAAIVARQLIEKSRLLADQPRLGHAIAGHEQYRQLVMKVLNAAYVFQYRVERDRIVMLRVFHGSEARE
jgi:plasmid stabilization system protein ParE